jgi:DNA-binding MarR family transcriptional regulator
MSKPNSAALDAHLSYWLRLVSNHVSHAFKEKLKARDISVAEWVVLRELHGDQPPAPTQLAIRLGMRKGAVSKLLDRLAAKGFTTEMPSRQDRRCRILALTPQGRALVPKLAALADRNDAEFFGHLQPAERDALQTVLLDIVRRHGWHRPLID